MQKNKLTTAFILLITIMSGFAGAEIMFETRNMRIEFTQTGLLKSLIDKTSSKQYVQCEQMQPAFMVYKGDKSFAVEKVSFSQDQLTVEFPAAGVTANYEVIQKDEYIALKLTSIEGSAIDRIDLLKIDVKKSDHLANWINAVRYADFGVCLCGGNVKTNARMKVSDTFVTMTAKAYNNVALEGTIAILFDFAGSTDSFLDVMEVVEKDFNMPSGAKNRRSPFQRLSYTWSTPNPKNVDDYIKWAKKCGFPMIMISYRDFTDGAGHYTFNKDFPNGMADLKKVNDAIRAAGLQVGMHLHYNKVVKTDPYVTPVPDERLHLLRKFTLAKSIDDRDNTIIVNENPQGCTHDKGRTILKLGKELIEYTSYTTEPPFQFTDCHRGHLDTKILSHEAGDKLGLLNIDTWDIFIRIDQDTDLQDEMARRFAEIYNNTGPYAFLYLDGAEDIHEPFWYNCANAQYRVYKLLNEEPAICETAANTHFSWHMASRCNAYDSALPDKLKEYISVAQNPGAINRSENFSRVDYGWVWGDKKFGRDEKDSIRPDAMEYLISRAAGWDCPYSVVADLPGCDDGFLDDDCFGLMRLWEQARLSNRITKSMQEKLKDLKKEHHLFINENGQHELVELEPLTDIPIGHIIRAYMFSRAQSEKNYVLLWADSDEVVDVFLPLAPKFITLMKPFGNEIELKEKDGKYAIPVKGRSYLEFSQLKPKDIRKIFSRAKCSAGIPTAIYKDSADLISKNGSIDLVSSPDGSPHFFVDLPYQEAIGDCLVPTGPATADDKDNWYADYKFKVPYPGRWYLWGRMKYKNEYSDTFFASLAGKPETKQVYGGHEKGVWAAGHGAWVWDGVPVFDLEAGEVTIRIHAGDSLPRISPRLNVLCLTNDSYYRPNKEDAVKQLNK